MKVSNCGAMRRKHKNGSSHDVRRTRVYGNRIDDEAHSGDAPRS